MQWGVNSPAPILLAGEGQPGIARTASRCRCRCRCRFSLYHLAHARPLPACAFSITFVVPCAVPCAVPSPEARALDMAATGKRGAAGFVRGCPCLRPRHATARPAAGPGQQAGAAAGGAARCRCTPAAAAEGIGWVAAGGAERYPAGASSWASSSAGDGGAWDQYRWPAAGRIGKRSAGGPAMERGRLAVGALWPVGDAGGARWLAGTGRQPAR